MKTFSKILFLSVVLAVTGRADSLSDLSKFFYSKHRNTTVSAVIDRGVSGSDKDRREAKGVAQYLATGWASQLESVASTASADERTLLIEVRRSQAALIAASTDKAQVDEALRTLVALRARVPKLAP